MAARAKQRFDASEEGSDVDNEENKGRGKNNAEFEDDIEYKIFYERREIKEVKKKQKANIFKDIESAHQEVLQDLQFYDFKPEHQNEKIFQKVKQNKINILDFAPMELIEEDMQKDRERRNTSVKRQKTKVNNEDDSEE